MGSAKNVSLLSGLLFSLALGFVSGQSPQPARSDGPQVKEDYRVTERGPHHRVCSATSWETNRLGQIIARTNSYLELANGLHYTNSISGQWEESNPAFEITDDGFAVARRCQHQVVITPNLDPKDGVVVDLLTPDGQHLRSGVIGLSLFDPKSGSSLQVGMVRDVVGTLVSSNEIVWFDAFEGLRADVRIRNERGAFHQDILLKEKLSDKQLAALGFDVQTVRLEVWTAFVGAPAPVVQRVVFGTETNAAIRATLAEPDEVDSILKFGRDMEMGAGSAFIESDPDKAIRVLKQWQETDGKRFLIEATSYRELLPLLEALPVKTAALKSGAAASGLAVNRTPPGRVKRTSVAAREVKMAQLDSAVPFGGPHVVLDYVLVTALPNYTFQGDTTYYVNSLVNLSGTTTIEGGTVVKFSPGASSRVILNGPVSCQTAPYRPAIFTARDDDTVGKTIAPYSDGVPGNEYFGSSLTLGSGVGSSANLTDLRFRFMNGAIVSQMPSYARLSCTNCQFFKCGTGVYLSNHNNLNLRNALFANIMAIWVDGQNIAVVPGSSPPQPVAVNNIHNGYAPHGVSPSNPQLFVDNETSLPGPFNIQYNGLTVFLTTTNKTISTGSTHRVKIAIADAEDQKLDSAVFIKASTPCP